jgi:hypothetical protein
MSDGNLVPLAPDGMGVFNMPEGRFLGGRDLRGS